MRPGPRQNLAGRLVPSVLRCPRQIARLQDNVRRFEIAQPLSGLSFPVGHSWDQSAAVLCCQWDR
jgi:hypothetical protein